ncbi:hypothetical protein Taro_044598 [Colocasia esculenta]|uniref:Uncharacterized protein n=1 Tax=Colocasia esculenta TaxID=4460 RepID=A0A843WP42_COLES|nr:hypothetical protein [Colocasia esculenta]
MQTPAFTLPLLPLVSPSFLKVHKLPMSSFRTSRMSSKKQFFDQSYPLALMFMEQVLPPWITLSEWFLIHHKNTFAPFIQKEIKLIRHYKMYNDYCYLHNQLEVQLGQFKKTISLLHSTVAHTHSIAVDFATLEIPDVVFLPPIHSLVMESSVGTLIFERYARVMARDPYESWMERYKKSLSRDEYADLLEIERQLHLKRMAPVMGPSYSVVHGVFQIHFEEQERKAWPIITRHASLLPEDSWVLVFPFVLKEDLEGSRVVFSSSGCEEKTSCGWVCRDQSIRRVHNVSDPSVATPLRSRRIVSVWVDEIFKFFLLQVSLFLALLVLSLLLRSPEFQERKWGLGTWKCDDCDFRNIGKHLLSSSIPPLRDLSYCNARIVLYGLLPAVGRLSDMPELALELTLFHLAVTYV